MTLKEFLENGSRCMVNGRNCIYSGHKKFWSGFIFTFYFHSTKFYIKILPNDIKLNVLRLN